MQNLQGGMISGHITNETTGEPLSGATLRLETPAVNFDNLSRTSYGLYGGQPTSQKSPSQTNVYTSTSLSDGEFFFQSIKPGNYVLTASKQGFLNTTYGGSAFSTTGKVLSLSEERLEGIDLSLTPLSGVAGRVTDESGNVIVNANVVAVKQTWIQGRKALIPVQGVQSNELGEYRIGKLTPGMYYVYAQPMPHFFNGSTSLVPRTSVDNSNWKTVRTYYPAALDLGEGQLIEVPVGNDLQGINIRVRRAHTFHVKGRVIGAKEELQAGSVDLMPANQEQIALILGGVPNVSPDGLFDFGDIAPGTYDLNFRSPLATARMQLEVNESDVSVDLPVVSNGTLRGKVVLDEVPEGISLNSSTLKATLVQADSLLALSYPVTLNSEGELAADNIPAAKYFLKVVPRPQLYVKSISVEGSEVTDGKVDMSNGGTTNITIQLRAGLASVSGTVDRDESFSGGNVPPVHVILLPSPFTLFDIYFGTTDRSNHFNIGSIKPGTYRVLALESINTQILQNPSALQNLERLGTEIDVKESQNSALNLHIVTADTLERASADINLGQ